MYRHVKIKVRDMVGIIIKENVRHILRLVPSLQQTDSVRVAIVSGNVDGSPSILCREANMTSCSNCMYTLS